MKTDKPATNAANPAINVSDIDNAPEGLPGAGTFDAQWTPRLNDDFARVSDENARLEIEVIELKRRLAAKTALDALIRPMADKSFIFMCCYSAFVGALLLLGGFGARLFFSLPVSVMNLLVGSTAVTVIGLVGMVLTGVFAGARK